MNKGRKAAKDAFGRENWTLTLKNKSGTNTLAYLGHQEKKFLQHCLQIEDDFQQARASAEAHRGGRCNKHLFNKVRGSNTSFCINYRSKKV